MVAAAVAAVAVGWATPRELAWMRKLGAQPCHVGPPPTARLRPAFAVACADPGRAPPRARRLPAEARARAADLQQEHVELHEHRLLADRIGDRPQHVDAHCWDFSDWEALNSEVAALYDKGTEFRAAGFANIGAGSVELDPYTCMTLALLQAKAYANDYRADARGFGEEVDVLAHEATHARGIANEAETECEAIQLVPKTTVMLGLPARIGRLFANALWRAYRFEPKGYGTPKCHNGGPYDIHPRSAVWP